MPRPGPHSHSGSGSTRFRPAHSLAQAGSPTRTGSFTRRPVAVTRFALLLAVLPCTPLVPPGAWHGRSSTPVRPSGFGSCTCPPALSLAHPPALHALFQAGGRCPGPPVQQAVTLQRCLLPVTHQWYLRPVTVYASVAHRVNSAGMTQSGPHTHSGNSSTRFRPAHLQALAGRAAG